MGLSLALIDPPDVLYHGTKRNRAKSVLEEGFRHAKTPTYTGTGTCMTTSIAVAYEYGEYESGGCVMEVVLRKGGRYADLDTSKAPAFSPELYDRFARVNDLDALCSPYGHLWVLWKAEAVHTVRVLSKAEAHDLLLEEFAREGATVGYNGIAGDYAAVFHDDKVTLQRMQSWQREDAYKGLAQAMKRWERKVASAV